MLTEYDNSNNLQRKFIYGNYIDEVLLMIAGENDYYYAHDHLYSPAVLIDSSGTVLERYEYDAYGNCSILEPNFAPDPDGKSDYGNPYLFTGRRLDILNSGSLKIQYNRNRYYDYYTGRWLTHDPLGITPNPQKPNYFNPIAQTIGGLNTYEFAESNPLAYTDPYGLYNFCCDCPEGTLAEWNTPGRSGSWGYIRARIWFMFERGRSVEFNAKSRFSKYVKNTIRAHFRSRTVPNTIRERIKPIAENMGTNKCIPLCFYGDIHHYSYWGDGSFKWQGTIGSGGDDDYSDVSYRACCCFRKSCCVRRSIDVDVKCKVLITIEDLYGYHYYPDQARLGTNFWTIIHFFDDFGELLSVKCN